jgi:hypothetical protein
MPILDELYEELLNALEDQSKWDTIVIDPCNLGLKLRETNLVLTVLDGQGVWVGMLPEIWQNWLNLPRSSGTVNKITSRYHELVQSILAGEILGVLRGGGNVDSQ